MTLLAIVLHTTTLLADNRPPDIPNTIAANPLSDSAIEVQWNASSDNQSVAGYNVYRDGQFLTTVQGNYLLDEGLESDTSYYYWVVAFDEARNFSANSRWVFTRTTTRSSWQHSQANDTAQPPAAPQHVSAVLSGNNTVEVSWTRPEGPGDIAGFNVYRDDRYYATVSTEWFEDSDSAVGHWHSYEVVAFTADRHYSAHSANAAVFVPAVESAVTPDSITTTADNTAAHVQSDTQPDSQPASKSNSQPNSQPSVPQSLSANPVSANRVLVTWQAPAHGTAAGYNVYRDNAYVATVTQPEWTDTAVSGGNTYVYQTVAYDNQQRFSVKSAELWITTPPNNSATIDAPRVIDEKSGVSPDLSDYYLAFSDEFNGNGLDPYKWNTAYLWGPDLTTNNEQQYYVDINNYPDFGYQPFSGNGDYLSIKADRTPEHLRDKANWKPYISGVMTSYDAFQFTYGYAEARIRPPTGPGMFSAFWLLNAYYVDLEPEIDIMESLGENSDVVYHTYHYRDAWGNLVSSPSYETWGNDFSNDFHVYAVKWSPGEIIWYVDGVERHRLAHDKVSSQPMYVLFNLAIDGDWPVSPDWTTQFPSTFDIDYVRVYQRN